MSDGAKNKFVNRFVGSFLGALAAKEYHRVKIAEMEMPVEHARILAERAWVEYRRLVLKWPEPDDD